MENQRYQIPRQNMKIYNPLNNAQIGTIENVGDDVSFSENDGALVHCGLGNQRNVESFVLQPFEKQWEYKLDSKAGNQISCGVSDDGNYAIVETKYGKQPKDYSMIFILKKGEILWEKTFLKSTGGISDVRFTGNGKEFGFTHHISHCTRLYMYHNKE